MILQEKIKKAELYEINSNWEEAITLYNEIIDEDDSTLNLEKLGWCLSRAGKYDESIRYFMILEKREPKMAKWKYMIGYQYYSKREWNNAVKYFEETLKIKPQYLVVKYRISYAYLQLAGTYKKLTKPEFWKALGHIKDCHELWNNFDEKNKHREKHTYFDINFLHGKMLMELPNHREEAIIYFKNALRIKDDEICKYNLAKTYYLIGNYEKAKEFIPQSNNYYVIELNAYIEAKLKNYDIAIRDITKLIQKRKKDYLFTFLSEVFLLKNDNNRALENANKAVKMNFKNHKNHFILAKVYYKMNLYMSALKELDLANSLKAKYYNSEYEEANLLKKEILNIISDNYQENYKFFNNLNIENSDNTYIGIIENYNSNKKFGFIRSNNNKIFFHISDCEFNEVKKNKEVIFNVVKWKRNSKAINVKWK